MTQVTNILMSSAVAGLVSGGIAGAVTFGGRYVSKFPQLPYQSAAWTGAGFSVAILVALSSHKKLVSNNIAVLGILFGGGIVLATAANKMWFRRDLSILSNAATPTITSLSLFILVLTQT